MSKGLQILQELRNKSGLELYQNGMVSPHKDHFKVKSESEPLVYYEVKINDEISCRCLDHQKKGKILTCKHIIAVQEFIKNTPILAVCQ